MSTHKFYPMKLDFRWSKKLPIWSQTDSIDKDYICRLRDIYGGFGIISALVMRKTWRHLTPNNPTYNGEREKNKHRNNRINFPERYASR